MTFIPPYINTFRSLWLDFTSGTGRADCVITVPFDVDEIIFRGCMCLFPDTSPPLNTQYSLFTCPYLTNGESTAVIAFSHYTSTVDTFQSSSGTIISYMYPSPKNINGTYTFYEQKMSTLGDTFPNQVDIIVEFRKYN